MRVERATPTHLAGWAALRRALWPDEALEGIDALGAMLADRNAAVFVALSGEDVTGFVEASVRHDYVNGCDGSPVGFVEGLYVAPVHRQRGVARALVTAVQAWATDRGLNELASDALIDNGDSHAMHVALGFAETERVVYFRKLLGSGAGG